MKALKNKFRYTFTGNPLNGLTKEDVLISSFPKTGSTYTRFVLANIVSLLNNKSDPVDFYSLGNILPECKKDDLASFEWTGAPLPRFVKTHEYLHEDSVYLTPRTIYIVRDPRDTMISYFHYANKRKSNRFTGTFNEFVNDKEFGIEAYNLHVHEWYDHATWIFQYESLMVKPLDYFKKLLNELAPGKVSDEILELAIAHSSPDRLKDVEAKNSRPGHAQNFDEDFKFVRNSSVNQWKQYLNQSESDYIIKIASNTLKQLYQ